MTKPISPLLPIAYSKEVASAKQRGAPVVALESTIITHGMPYPGNIEMARSVEAIIREQGAVLKQRSPSFTARCISVLKPRNWSNSPRRPK